MASRKMVSLISFMLGLRAIVGSGFGLGGLVFNAEFKAREQRTDCLDDMDALNDEEEIRDAVICS